jgi:hypothetical protein
VSLSQFIESSPEPECTLVVENRTAPQPIQAMLDDLFENQAVTVDEQDRLAGDENRVYLLRDGEVAATSPLSALRDAVLLINSDTYVTGARDPDDVDLPDVIAALEGRRFTLRGYPESDSEKLLLIVVSRYVERLSLESGGGKHRASFQRLSRIDDEKGTRSVYERLADSPVDVHIYGVPDWTPSRGFDVTMHGGWSPEFTDSWFVVHRPEDDGTPAALVANELEPGFWEGVWTFDPERVAAVECYVAREL